jgi:hypothetical protein
MKKKRPIKRRKRKTWVGIDRCKRCGRSAKEHYLANYSDGPHIGINVLICPTSVFEDEYEFTYE